MYSKVKFVKPFAHISNTLTELFFKGVIFKFVFPKRELQILLLLFGHSPGRLKVLL